MSGSDAMPKMYADLFQQLLTFVEFAVKPPKFGKVDAKSVSLMKTNQVIKHPHVNQYLQIGGRWNSGSFGSY